MKKFSFLIAFCLISLLMFGQESPVVSFPGAEGFGKYASGGRGGRIFIVTNLNDSGLGSLREAVEAKGPRTVVFEVSGNIELKSSLKVGDDNLTIAGQTAPGDGITLQNSPMQVVGKSNVIIRFMRFRGGDLGVKEGDAFEARLGTSNLIIDHCSFSWGTDETCSVYGVTNATVQYSIIAEGLNDMSRFGKNSPHAYGSLVGGNGLSLFNNLWSHFWIRNPSISGNDDRGIVDIRNNTIYNWGMRATDNGPLSTANLINNYYKPGPASFLPKLNPNHFLNPTNLNDDPNTYGKFYLNGNKLEGRPEISNDQWLGVRLENTPLTNLYLELCKNKDQNGKLVPFPIPAGTYSRDLSAEEAYEEILRHAGASLVRDKVDQRIINEVRTGTTTFKGSKTGLPGIIDSQKDVGGWPVLKSLPAPKDTDRDGMPDTWEIENGLNPNAADHNGYKLHKHYTNIEVYLNSLVAHIMEGDKSEPISVTGVSINPKSLSLEIGKTAQLSATVSPTYASNKSVIWTSSDSNIVTVNATGLVKGIKAGTATITSKTQDGGFTASAEITITPTNNSSLSIASFTLVNADTDKDISVIENNSQLDIAQIQDLNLNIRVNTNPDIVGSISIALSGPVEDSNTENSPPYALFGDNGGDYSGKKLMEGQYTLEATPYSESNLGGTKGTTLSILFSIGQKQPVPTVPVLLSPSNNSTGLPTSPKLTWEKLDNADSYTLQVSTNSNFSVLVVNSKDLTNHDFTVKGLEEDTRYFWRVRATNEAGNSSFSQVWNFRTIKPISIAVAPTLLSPSNNSTGLPTSTKLTWGKLDNADSYTLQVSTNSNFSNLVVNENLTNSDFSITGLKKDTRYFWRVQATNKAGSSSFSQVWNFRTIKPISIPVAPTLLSPSNNSTGLPTSPKLTWEKLADADSYTLQVSTNSNFTVLVVDTKDLNSPDFSVTGLKKDTRYFWRVRATNEAGSSSFSQVWNFRTIKSESIPLVPTLLSPSDKAENLSNTLNFQWSAVSNAKTYRIQISTESDFKTLFIDNAAITANSSFVRNLALGKIYYWRISAINDAGTSPYSPIWTFQTKASSIPPIAPTLISPKDKATDLPTALKLTWGTIENADKYAIQVSKSPNFSSFVINDNALTINEFNLENLQDDTSYFWRVRASNVAGNSAYSPVWIFKTVKPILIPAIPTLLSPSNGEKNLLSTLNFQWNSIPNAKTYHIQISKESNFATLIFDNATLTTNSIQVNNLEEGITYYWRVSAQNEDGKSDFSQIWKFETKIHTEPPVSPILISPTDQNTELSSTVKLVWGSVQNAVTYTLEVSTKSDFSSFIVNNSTLKSTEFTISGLAELTQYFWRIKASNSAGSSVWSPIWSFTTKEKMLAPAVPILLAPENASAGLTGKVTLKWSKPERVEVYRIQIAKDKDFINKQFDLYNIPTETFEISTLDKGVAYYWRVSASNEGGSSAFSEAWKFETLSLPEIPKPISPSDRSENLDTKIIFTWQKTSGALAYRLQVSASKDFSQNLIERNTQEETSAMVENLAEGKTYYWRIRASNAAGNSLYSNSWEFNTKISVEIPPTPILVSPSSGSLLDSEDITLNWKSVETAERYQIQISKFSNFSQAIVFNNNTVNTNELRIEGMEPDVVYFWRVRAINLAGVSPYSTVWNFKTKALLKLDAPNLISPKDSITINSTSVEFKWDRIAEAAYYQLHISKDSTFAKNNKTIDLIAGTEWTLDSLDWGASYFWKVTAHGKRPTSQSEIWKINIVEEKALLLARLTPIKISMYPNPFSDILHLEFSKQAEGEVIINIFDSKGVSVFESKVENPEEKITLSIPKDLPRGVYIIKIQGFGLLESKRVIKE